MFNHSESPKIVVVVQARMGSTRLPAKVLKPILGKSLLDRMLERLFRIKYPVKIVVATSNETVDDILEIEAGKIGVKCFRGSLTNLLDRHYQAAQESGADLVLKIPSDCPLIDPQVVDKVLDYFFNSKEKLDFVSNLHPASWPDGNDVELMTFSCLEKTWKEAVHGWELEHTTPYIWENPERFKIGNIIREDGRDLSTTFRFTIDHPEDYQFIKEVYEGLYPHKPLFSCEDILDFLTNHPEIYFLNSQYLGDYWYKNHLGDLKTIFGIP